MRPAGPLRPPGQAPVESGLVASEGQVSGEGPVGSSGPGGVPSVVGPAGVPSVAGVAGVAGATGATGAAGRVALVGAGPGDPELLTLRAARAIAEADVILIDDLVDRRVLAHARADARVVEVGKRGGCVSTPQAFIERLLVGEAIAGRNVVRLKGGDPFLFGRGGEEVAQLRAHGIPVDVVPGITSGMAAPAAVGIPVTHRDCTRGVIFVTGHAQSDLHDVDWAALAATGLTLVIYMGVARAAHIRARLIEAGLSPELPAAAVQDGTRPTQRALATTLGALDADLAAAGLGSPAILVVGEVARLADAALVGRIERIERVVPAGRERASHAA